MANKANLDKHLRAIHSVSKDSMKEPYIPMDNYLGEVETLCYTARKDIEQLTTLGFTEERITYVEELAEATRYAQAAWYHQLKEQEEALKTWKLREAVAVDLRAQILHTLRFKFRKNEEMLDKVRLIEEGDSGADLVQDFSDLSVLLRKYGEELADLISPELAEETDKLSAELADLLAAANGERHAPNEDKIVRNQAYTLLKEEVDELREFGKFLFWKDPKHAEKYASAYLRKKNRRHRTSTSEEQ